MNKEPGCLANPHFAVTDCWERQRRQGQDCSFLDRCRECAHQPRPPAMIPIWVTPEAYARHIKKETT